MINAQGYEQRRTFQLRQAERLGFEIQFIDAVSIADLTEDELQDAANQWTRSIARKDVACTYSHWRAWETVAAQDEKACILEDDVVLSPTFLQVLSAIDRRDEDWNCVYDLEYSPSMHTLGKSPIWSDATLGIDASLVYKNKRGAAAYVLGPKSAQRLRQEFTRYAMMESILWSRRWMQQMQIEPCQAIQMEHLEKPTIEIYKRVKGPRPQNELTNQSWVRAKMRRLSVSLNEAKPAFLGAVLGNKRPLRFEREKFDYPQTQDL